MITARLQDKYNRYWLIFFKGLNSLYTIVGSSSRLFQQCQKILDLYDLKCSIDGLNKYLIDAPIPISLLCQYFATGNCTHFYPICALLSVLTCDNFEWQVL